MVGQLVVGNSTICPERELTVCRKKGFVVRLVVVIDA